MAARGKTEHADLVRIDAPRLRTRAQQADGALRILHRHRHAGKLETVRPRTGNAILQHDAGDAFPREPVADLGAFEIDCEYVVAAAWKHDDCGARILALGRKHRHRRASNVLDHGPWTPCDR